MLLLVITDEPDGNFIVGNDVAADGKLTFKYATWAGGKGNIEHSNLFCPYIYHLLLRCTWYSGSHSGRSIVLARKYASCRKQSILSQREDKLIHYLISL